MYHRGHSEHFCLHVSSWKEHQVNVLQSSASRHKHFMLICQQISTHDTRWTIPWWSPRQRNELWFQSPQIPPPEMMAKLPLSRFSLNKRTFCWASVDSFLSWLNNGNVSFTNWTALIKWKFQKSNLVTFEKASHESCSHKEVFPWRDFGSYTNTGLKKQHICRKWTCGWTGKQDLLWIYSCAISGTGGSRFIRICLNRNWRLSEVLSKHFNPCCVILYA